jgi:hypothetical protein
MYKEEWLYAWFWTGTSVEQIETTNADIIGNAHPTENYILKTILKRIKYKKGMSFEIASELIKYETKRMVLKRS